MKELKLNIALASGLLSLTLAAISLIDSIGGDKIAYVRSSDLVYGYVGMKTAQNGYQEKAKAWQFNVDKLQKEYQTAANKFSAEFEGLTDAQKDRGRAILARQQEDLMGYSKALQTKANEEDEKITQSVLNQINSFVEEYGDRNGYEIILGTTLSGSLLYGDDAIDITDEVLKALNKTYVGE